jgi:hypothetical protein
MTRMESSPAARTEPKFEGGCRAFQSIRPAEIEKASSDWSEVSSANFGGKRVRYSSPLRSNLINTFVLLGFLDAADGFLIVALFFRSHELRLVIISVAAFLYIEILVTLSYRQCGVRSQHFVPGSGPGRCRRSGLNLWQQFPGVAKLHTLNRYIACMYF